MEKKVTIEEHEIRIGMNVNILKQGYVAKDEDGKSMRLENGDFGTIVFVRISYVHPKAQMITVQFENSFVDLPLSELNQGYEVLTNE